MALSLDALLAPVSDDSPTGPDLAYDPARYQLEQAFETSVSIDANGQETAAAEIDWRSIVQQIEDQSAKTKDVWLAVYLCRAGARQQSLETVETGAEFLAGLLETYWPIVHPSLDEYGFQGRKGPCDSLTAPGFIRALQAVPLLSHPRLGRFSGADLDRFRSGREAAEGYGMFRAALQELSEEALLEAVGRIDRIDAGFRRADAVLTANAQGDTGTNFQPTYAALEAMKKGVLAFTSTPPATAESGAETASAPGVEVGGATGPRVAGRIDSREDVISALDAIAEYYRRKEPTSPIPLVLQRARDWVMLDFLSVLEDIAPGGLDEAKRVLVSQRPEKARRVELKLVIVAAKLVCV